MASNAAPPAASPAKVDDALRIMPCVKSMTLVVALPQLKAVKGKAPPVPVPHETPVFEIRPVAENVAQPGVPPAEETIKLVVEPVPVMVRPVVEAKGKTEAVLVVAI